MPRGLRVSRWLLLAGSLAGWSLALGLQENADAERTGSDFEEVARSGFTMSLPAWNVEIDDDLGASGRHARTEGSKRAEVSWFLHEGGDLDAFDVSLDALRKGYGMTVVERRAQPQADPPRLEALLDFAGRGWFAMTQIACPRVGVAVTVNVVAPDRAEASALSERVLDTFSCRSPDLPRLVETWPHSDLSREFGLSMEGSPVLVHADGRWVMVARQSQDTVRGMAADGERAGRVLGGYGAVLGDTWSLAEAGREVRNLSGAATAWRLDSAQRGVVAASAFTCGDGSAFVTLAGDDTARTDAASLAALLGQFGCADESQAPPVTERPSACDAGVADFCEMP